MASLLALLLLICHLPSYYYGDGKLSCTQAQRPCVCEAMISTNNLMPISDSGMLDESAESAWPDHYDPDLRQDSIRHPNPVNLEEVAQTCVNELIAHHLSSYLSPLPFMDGDCSKLLSIALATELLAALPIMFLNREYVVDNPMLVCDRFASAVVTDSRSVGSAPTTIQSATMGTGQHLMQIKELSAGMVPEELMKHPRGRKLLRAVSDPPLDIERAKSACADFLSSINHPNPSITSTNPVNLDGDYSKLLSVALAAPNELLAAGPSTLLNSVEFIAFHDYAVQNLMLVCDGIPSIVVTDSRSGGGAPTTFQPATMSIDSEEFMKHPTEGRMLRMIDPPPSLPTGAYGPRELATHRRIPHPELTQNVQPTKVKITKHHMM